MTPEGARLIGLALEEYIKVLVSKAIHAASHRTLQFKESDHREKITDVRHQFKYLQGSCQTSQKKFILSETKFFCVFRVGL